MSGAGLLRLPEAKYDSDLMALYGLSDALPLLPELVQPTDVIGQVNASAADATGLRVGTPVVAGYFDVVASALGSGVVGPGAASIVLGTWSINQVFCEAPLRDPRVFMSSAFGQGRFSSMDNSATSAANLEWYVRTFLNHVGSHEEQFAMVNEWIGRDSFKPDDPMFHPFLYGGRNGPHQRGGFYGLASWHDQGHILRALCEGVCFEHRRHVDTLISAGAAVSAVHLSGGGCRSPHWPQMMANVLGNSVTLGSADETGALGAAIAAATGVGVYATEELSVSAMTRPRTHLQPNAQQQEVHSARFAAWTQLTSSLEPFWLELEELRRS